MREAVVTSAALVAINKPPPPSSHNITNLGAEALLHSDLVQTPQIVGFVQLPPIGPLILSLVSNPDALFGFQLLRANLVLQGTNELVNNIYNIVRHYNLLAIE